MTTALAVAMLLIFFRVAAFVTFFPPFAGSSFPNSVKIGLAMALSLLWGIKLAPLVALGLSPAMASNWVWLGWLAVRETVLGAGLAWLLGLVLVPVRIAGSYLLQEMGLTIGAMTSPTEAMSGSALSQLLEIMTVLLILGMNLHHQFLRVLNATFEVFPLGGTWLVPEQDWFIGSIAGTAGLGLQLAAPVGVVLFITLIALLYMMRQVQQFNLMTFGMPVRLLVGLCAMLLFLPELVGGTVNFLTRFGNLEWL